ncbi:YlbG family protein [Companilactobacillus crustorum]|uniref:YlbG family protein n=1 Tax=Companilactobacillus crustorum TaxID=392416 RepID=UPI00237DEBF2|nr:YlbG family protein [Companilactobacillus crustorum]WDT66402.1 YlbG family protein [Companilactobacillus crustorum]
MYKKVERQALYVWVYSLKWRKKLQRYGTVYYTSPKMKYIMLYVNSNRAAEVKKELMSKNYVKRVFLAHRKELDEHYVLKSKNAGEDNK